MRVTDRRRLDGRLAAYVAGIGAVGTAMASEAEAVVVINNTVQPFGINDTVNIDFNSDGQLDFQIDHDRYNLNGTDLDYLQIDKNDINGESNPLDFDPITGFQAATFPPGATTPNDANNSAYVIDGPQGSYPAALSEGALIGQLSGFDFQESNDFQGSGDWIRANRLMDEDMTQIDQVLGGQAPADVVLPTNGPNFDNLAGEVRYLGLKMELNNTGLNNYGWVGVRINNEADATGEVVGFAYQTTPSVPIRAGQTGQIPEPTTIVTALMGGAMMLGCVVWRRLFRR